jgi:hypothetical protein
LYTADDRRVDYLFKGINLIHQGLEARRKWMSDEWAQMCFSAGILYELKHRRSDDAEDFNSAVVMYLETWSFKAAPLLKRLKAVNLASNLLVQKSRWLEAWDLLQEAVKLIPLYCASSPAQQDQQYMISDLSGITSRACTAGLAIGETTRALEIWEQGRGMIISASYHAVGELSKLSSQHPNLFEDFWKCRQAVIDGDAMSNTLTRENSLGDQYFASDQSRLDNLAMLDEVIRKLRRCEGFEYFLQSMTAARMQTLAGEGAAVVLNSSSFGTHAILVTKASIRAIQLEPTPQFPDFFGDSDPYMSSNPLKLLA